MYNQVISRSLTNAQHNKHPSTFSQCGTDRMPLDDKEYVFRSVLCTPPFKSGQHYWELTMDGRTENEMKIGVICNDIINFDSAFCDY